MIELTRGQELPLTDGSGASLGRIQLGLGWDKERTAGFMGSGAPDVDLDMSAIQFTGQQLFDLAFFNNLSTRDGSVVHQGDNLSGRGEGDDEVVTVDLPRVHPPVDRIAVLVSSYQGHSLRWVARAYCRVLTDDGTEIARLTLTNGVPETGIVMAVLVRDGDGWRLRAVGDGIPVKVPTEAVDALRPYL
ncbi:MAG: TerD family protein [Nocardioidaceae bacterium]